MIYDSKENAVVRGLALWSDPMDDKHPTLEPRTIFRILMTDGRQFNFTVHLNKGISPESISQALIDLGKRIHSYYKQKQDDDGH